MVKLKELDSRVIWGICLIIYIIPVLWPIGAPILVSDITIEIYDYLEALPDGSIVVMGGSGVFAFDFEPGAAMMASIIQLSRLDVRLVAIPFGVESLQFHKYMVDSAGVMEKDGGPWKYGEDFVQLPYIPGGNAAIVRLLGDVHATVKTDAYGTPLSEIPLMRDFINYENISIWLCPHWGYGSIVRFVTGERGVPSVMFAHSYSYTVFAPYMMIYPDKVWMTNGFLGGAQYEQLVGIKGLGHAAVDSYALISLTYLGFVILGNLTMYMKEEEEEEQT
ncbi:hypothetical protein ES703_92114 [subsurface metagenome]